MRKMHLFRYGMALMFAAALSLLAPAIFPLAGARFRQGQAYLVYDFEVEPL